MRFKVALAIALAVGCASPGAGAEITSARYEVDLDVYPHRIMGSIREKAVLVARDAGGREYKTDLRAAGQSHNVFEDIAPRVVDVNGDGVSDVVVVETSQTEGAQLAIYGLRRSKLVKIAATPHIGKRFRWLAPVGISDLDGNGTIELAYVDRPHLAKTLRIWSWLPGGLTEIASIPDVTNHRIGDEVIWGGLRDCGEGPEMVLADGAFRQIVLIRFTGDTIRKGLTNIRPTRRNFDRVLACERP